jgi:hypothetical protein
MLIAKLNQKGGPTVTAPASEQSEEPGSWIKGDSPSDSLQEKDCPVSFFSLKRDQYENPVTLAVRLCRK